MKLWSYPLALGMGFQCLAHFTTSKNSEVRHLWDPQHLYLPWFFVNIVIFNLLLPYRLGCLALPNIFRKICFCNFTSDDTQKNSSDHALSQLAMHLFRNQLEAFLTKWVFLYFHFGYEWSLQPCSLRSPGLIKLRQVWCSVHDDGIKNAHRYMFNIPVGKWQIQGTFVSRFHVSCL